MYLKDLGKVGKHTQMVIMTYLEEILQVITISIGTLLKKIKRE
jgi:hypothetical protein